MIEDLTATATSFALLMVLVKGLINFYILISNRNTILKIKKNIEDLTTVNDEVSEKSLLRFQSLEKKVNLASVIIVVVLVIREYFAPIFVSTLTAAMGGDFAFNFPAKVLFPYEITSMSIYILSYAVIFTGTFSVIFIGVIF